MSERWVECTRFDGGETMYVNMADAYIVGVLKRKVDDDKLPEPVTHIFALSGGQGGLTCELVNEPPEHFIDHAGTVVYQAKDVRPEVAGAT